MPAPKGKSLPISRARRIVCDFLAASQGLPTVTIGRAMNLADVVAARQAASPRPSWSAIFTKAYALAAAPERALRTTMLSFPWPRLHEHHRQVASIVVERPIDDEQALLLVRPTNGQPDLQ